jgi:hypothetical protein
LSLILPERFSSSLSKEFISLYFLLLATAPGQILISLIMWAF